MNSFPTTKWSLLGEASADDPAPRQDAFNRLVSAYWRPVYRFFRCKGFVGADAEELTQEFWLSCFTKRTLERADPNRGRFRSFLLIVLTRFAADNSPKRQRKQIAFEHGIVTVSVLLREDDREWQPTGGEAVEDVFMRDWARSVVADCNKQLETWCLDKGRPDWNQVFQAVHFPDGTGKALSQEQLAAALCCSRDQIRYALKQTNDKFSALLRHAVAEQVLSSSDIEDELNDLLNLVGNDAK